MTTLKVQFGTRARRKHYFTQPAIREHFLTEAFSSTDGAVNFSRTRVPRKALTTKGFKDGKLLGHSKPPRNYADAIGDRFVRVKNGRRFVASQEIAMEGGTPTYQFDALSHWSKVRNFSAQADEAQNLIANGFVHVDVELADATEGSTLEVNGSKRSNIATGSGDDQITVGIATNNRGLSNQFYVDSGAGDDAIVIQGADLTQGQTKYRWKRRPLITDGCYSEVFIDAGEGNDTITGYGSRDQIWAGAGDDRLIFNANEAEVSTRIRRNHRGKAQDEYDYFDGGAGDADALVIDVDEAFYAAHQAEIDSELSAYETWLAAGKSDEVFTFETLRLRVINIEQLEVTELPEDELPPEAINNTEAVVAQDSSFTFSTDNLSYRDRTSTPDEVQYQVTGGLYSGQLEYTDAPGVAITEFTQADIDAGRVTYVQTPETSGIRSSQADFFNFSVTDAQGNTIENQAFGIQTLLGNESPEDGVAFWAPGSGQTFVDGGDGEDAIALLGSDGADTVSMRPSADGTQIVFEINGETLSVDGFEDVYFLLGEGDNSVEIDGDFSGTDLSPNTLYFYGGDGNDRLVAGEGEITSFPYSLILDGRGGDDILGGGTGYNVLLGGDGQDDFSARSRDLETHIFPSKTVLGDLNKVGMDNVHVENVGPRDGTAVVHVPENEGIRITDDTEANVTINVDFDNVRWGSTALFSTAFMSYDSQGNLSQYQIPDTERENFGEYLDLLATDANGNIYIHDLYSNPNSIKIFESKDASFQLKVEFGERFRFFHHPRAVVVGHNGNKYVADSNKRRVFAFDANNEFVSSFGSFENAVDVATDHDGNIYVIDSSSTSPEVQVFNSNGDLNFKFGSKGTGDGQFVRPVAIETNSDGDIYVVDQARNDIQIFDKNGSFVSKIENREGSLSQITHINIGSNRNINIIDGLLRVKTYDSNKNFISQTRRFSELTRVKDFTTDQSGNTYLLADDDEFKGQIQSYAPNGDLRFEIDLAARDFSEDSRRAAIAVDGNGRLYVAGARTFTSDIKTSVDVYDTNGNFLFDFGSSLSEGSVVSPHEILVDASGNIYLAAHSGRSNTAGRGKNSLQVFDANGSFRFDINAENIRGEKNPSLGDIAVDSLGNVYAAFGSYIEVFDPNGNFLYDLDILGANPVRTEFRSRIEIDQNDRILIFDRGSEAVQIYAKDGSYIDEFISTKLDGEFEVLTDIAINQAGNIYLTDGSRDDVQVFDPNGEFQFKFGSRGNGDGQFSDLTGIEVDDVGKIYVTDDSLNANVQVFTSNGEFLEKFGSLGTNKGQIESPTDISVDSTGRIYVSSIGFYRSNVQVFSTSGVYQSQLKTPAPDGGIHAYNESLPMAIDGNGAIYIADALRADVQVFDADGNFQFKFGSEGRNNGQFILPSAITVDGTGKIYVTDRARNDVQIFDANGNFINQFGGTRGTTENGQFDDPNAIAVALDGRIYVADDARDDVQVFAPNGDFLFKFGSNGLTGNGEFTQPTSIAIDSDGRVHIADLARGDVQVFDANGNWLFTRDHTAGILPDQIRVASNGTITIDQGSMHQVLRLPLGRGNRLIGKDILLEGTGDHGFSEGKIFLVDEPVGDGNLSSELDNVLQGVPAQPNSFAYEVMFASGIRTDAPSGASTSYALFGQQLGTDINQDGQVDDLDRIEVLYGSNTGDLIVALDDPNISTETLVDLGVIDPSQPPGGPGGQTGDALYGLDGNDRLVGDRGSNYFDGGRGNDTMEGLDGHDLFQWSPNRNRILGGAGIDTVDYTNPLAGPQQDRGISAIFSAPGTATVLHFSPLEAKDTLTGIEMIIGNRFADAMVGHDGNETFWGRNGGDVLNGGGGNDTLFGELGADTLDGGIGIDQLDAGSGDDQGRFTIGEGGIPNSGDYDVYIGGNGSDTLSIYNVDLEVLSPEELADLVALNQWINSPNFDPSISQDYDALGLRVQGWETLRLLDPNLQPIILADILPQPPTDLTLSNNSVLENRAGRSIGTLIVSDLNPAENFTFDLSDNRFRIGQRSDGDFNLSLENGVALDFEAEQTVPLTIGVTDKNGLRYEETFTISVIDEFDNGDFPPDDIDLSSLTVTEEQDEATVGILSVSDPNPGTLINWTASDTRFEVVNLNTIAPLQPTLKLKEGISLDYETETTVTLTLTATDNTGLSYSEDFTLQVQDINENAAIPPSSKADLNGSNGFTFTDSVINGRTGLDASFIGDVNGDGYEDVIVAGPHQSFNAGATNKAYVIYGTDQPLTTPLTDTDLLNGAGSVIDLPNGVGQSVRGIGDINGDGLADFAIGGNNRRITASDAEASAYIFLGQVNGLPTQFDTTFLNGSNGFSLTMPIEFDVSENNITLDATSAGDINGDGYDDLLVVGGKFGQSSWVIYGQNTSFANSYNLPNANLSITELTGHFGPGAGIGDINNDGYDDLYLGGRNPLGQFGLNEGYIIYGQANGLGTSLDVVANAPTNTGTGNGGGSGTPSIPIGGPNVPSGTPIGSPVANGGTTSTPGSGNGTSNTTSPVGVKVIGKAGYLLSSTVQSAGDVNGDGIPDMILTGIPDVNQDSGEVYLLFGKEDDLPSIINLDNLDGTNGITLRPSPSIAAGANSSGFQTFGEAATGVGDVNGDGYDDILIRAIDAQSQLFDSHHYLIYGKPFYSSSTIEVDPSLAATEGLLLPYGLSFGSDRGIGGGGDFNGDGYDDFIFSDIFGNPVNQNQSAGESYVIFGNDFSGFVTQSGSNGDDVLIGEPNSDDILIGGQGNDTLIGRGRRDVYSGGAGDDVLVVTGNGIAEYDRLIGGSGIDTVRLDGAITFDLSRDGTSALNPAGNQLVQGIEVIDLQAGGSTDAGSLILGLNDILDLSDTNHNLMITGDEFDNVRIRGGWITAGSQTINGQVFDSYNNPDSPSFELLVQSDLNQTIT